MAADLENAGVNDREIRRVKVRVIEIRPQSFAREQRAGGDVLMLILVEAAADPEAEDERKNERREERESFPPLARQAHDATRCGTCRKPETDDCSAPASPDS